MVPVETEIQGVIKELKACGPLSIIFDGTTDVCEVIVVIARWCGDQFRPHQRLLAASFFYGHLDGEELTAFLADTIYIEMESYDVYQYCKTTTEKVDPKTNVDFLC
jgi:hypothetical protein